MSALRVGVSCCGVAIALAGAPSAVRAQARLGVQDAVDEALRVRPVLKAEAERIAAAEGLRQQAAARSNGEFQFSNENLRPGQTYGRDVDTLAVVTQPIDLTGRRDARIRVADQHVITEHADVARSRIGLIRAVTNAYWEAREAQEARDILKTTLDTFQQIVDFHAAQFRQGVIAEQDLLRVQLEQERLKVTAGRAALDAARTRAMLLRVIGRSTPFEMTLTEPLDASTSRTSMPTDEAVLASRPEIAAAEAALAEAEANTRLQSVLGRPEFSGLFGYKRTQLPDTTSGVNTMVAGMRMTVPWGDRNDGNRAAASADVRRQQALLEEVRTAVLVEYHAAVDEFRLRQGQITDIVIPLRRDGANLAQIAQSAYQQGGTDLVRLLDARRSQLDADLVWVHAMADLQQSAAALSFAAGEIK